MLTKTLISVATFWKISSNIHTRIQMLTSVLQDCCVGSHECRAIPPRDVGKKVHSAREYFKRLKITFLIIEKMRINFVTFFKNSYYGNHLVQ